MYIIFEELVREQKLINWFINGGLIKQCLPPNGNNFKEGSTKSEGA